MPFTGNVGDSDTWRIGAYGTNPLGYFTGKVDEVRIYDRALSATEIGSLTDVGAAGTAPTPVDSAPTESSGVQLAPADSAP
jgi:hypothetical protein